MNSLTYIVARLYQVRANRARRKSEKLNKAAEKLFQRVKDRARRIRGQAAE